MRFAILLFCIFGFVGCRWDSFDPLSATPKTSPGATMHIEQLQELVGQGVIERDVVIEGVVTSSDSCGNFYKQLIIQDATGAVELRASIYDLYLCYGRWRRVSLSLRGLAVGRYDGMLQVGYATDQPLSVDPIGASTLLERYLKNRAGLWLMVDPVPLEIEELNNIHVGLLVELRGGHFENAGRATWSAEQPYVSADGKQRVAVYTNQYATFADDTLPEGAVTLHAIVVQHKNKLQLKISSPEQDLFLEERF